jgi:hypothetical protein
MCRNDIPAMSAPRTFRYRALHGKRASDWPYRLRRRPPLVRTAWSQFSNQPLERPRCSGDAGSPTTAQKAGVEGRSQPRHASIRLAPCGPTAVWLPSVRSGNTPAGVLGPPAWPGFSFPTSSTLARMKSSDSSELRQVRLRHQSHEGAPSRRMKPRSEHRIVGAGRSMSRDRRVAGRTRGPHVLGGDPG